MVQKTFRIYPLVTLKWLLLFFIRKATLIEKSFETRQQSNSRHSALFVLAPLLQMFVFGITQFTKGMVLGVFLYNTVFWFFMILFSCTPEHHEALSVRVFVFISGFRFLDHAG